ncbi:hypothetical protein NAV26_19930 [Pseudomonas stutzeri]|uniref:hypothetical protein n=1 Tax=Stutzerimonas stutzeri TaxID=316 RepID=UPI00210D26AE|nr:hypothetical protein [Stutzerimonas stutzeri]MCQ4327229.1 hypothetical protein [Stutzerimonas stutzeri]
MPLPGDGRSAAIEEEFRQCVAAGAQEARSGLACLPLPSRQVRASTLQTTDCIEAIRFAWAAGRSGVRCLDSIFLPSSGEVTSRNSEQGYDTNFKGHIPRPYESYEQHSNDNKRSDTMREETTQLERYYLFGIIIHDV